MTSSSESLVPKNGRPLLTQVLGGSASLEPFIAECVAVDITSALRGAEVGIRALRNRALLRRVWEATTGVGNERFSAIGTDLTTVQRATLHLVSQIMNNESRAWRCLEQVLQNLHAVNRDLDAVMSDLRLQSAEFQAAVFQTQTALAELEVQVSALREGLDREASLRRRRDQYVTGVLYPGFGPLLRASLYVAHVRAHFSDTDTATRDEEARTAVAVVASGLPTLPRAVVELVVAEVSGTADNVLEAMVYVTSRRSGSWSAVLAGAAKRRLARLPVTDESVRELIGITAVFDDPSGFLSHKIRRPLALVEQLAMEIDA